MTDDPVLAAVQKFIDAVEARLAAERTENTKLRDEMRSLRDELQTRSAPQVIEGPPGPPGKDARGIERMWVSTVGELCVKYTNGDQEILGPVVGKDGTPGIGEKGERGADGLNGKDGAPSLVPGPKGDPGERGKDGIATREELESIIEERMADIQVRTFADFYQGVYDPSRTYARGLATTWGGSLWLSLAETKAKPGENADWRLVVKKGADGRK